MNNETIEIINAIGKQWKFLLTIFIITITIIKWKTIWIFLGTLSEIRLKRGTNELELKRENKEEIRVTEPEKNTQEKNSPKDKTEEKKLEEYEQNHSAFTLYHKAIFDKNYKESESQLEKMIQSEDSPKRRYELRISDFYWRYQQGNTYAFEELEQFTSEIKNDSEQKAFALYYLGVIYNDTNNPKNSLELLKESLSISKDDHQKHRCIDKISSIYYTIGRKKESLKFLLKNLNNLQEKRHKSNIYKSIAEYYKKEENLLFSSISYQKALELSPNNTSLLFDLAYSFGNNANEFQDLAILLYKKIIALDSSKNMALNNLGVSYSNVGLKIKSIESYKKSFKENNSLAASNLAYILIENGFEEEAINYLENAREKDKEPHDNVFSALETVKSQVKEEKNKEKNILEKANQKLIFFSQFGEYALNNEIISLSESEKWIMNELEVTVEKTEKLLIIEWESGEEKHSIRAKCINQAFNGSYSKPKRKTYTYSETDKYDYTSIEIYGYFSSENEILMLYEFENKAQKLKLIKNTTHNNG